MHESFFSSQLWVKLKQTELSRQDNSRFKTIEKATGNHLPRSHDNSDIKEIYRERHDFLHSEGTYHYKKKN